MTFFLILLLRIEINARASFDPESKNIDDIRSTLAEVLSKYPELGVFRAVFKAVAPDLDLAPPSRFTLLVPSNKAFDRLSRNTLEQIEYHDEHWRKYILHSISRVASAGIPSTRPEELVGLDGVAIKIKGDRGHLTLSGLPIVKVIHASNGTVYVIDEIESKDKFFKMKVKGQDDIIPSSL